MQKVVIRLLDLDLNDEGCKQRSIEAVSSQFFTGEVTISTDAEENTLIVIGKRVVPQVIVDRLGQYVCQAEVVSVETVEEAKPKKFQFADLIDKTPRSAAAERVRKLGDAIHQSKKTEPKLDPRFKTKEWPEFKPVGLGQYRKVDKQGGFAQNFNPPGGLPAGFVDQKHGGFAKNFNPPGLPAGFVEHKNGGFAKNFNPPGLPAGFADKKHGGFAQLAERHKLHKAPESGQYGFVDEHKNPYVGLYRDTSTSAATSKGWSTISGASTGSSTSARISRSSSSFSAASTGTSSGSSTTSAASILTSRGTSRIPGNSRDTETTTEILRQEKKKKEKK
ncbi:hypothetical protein C5167_047937 [Papaver somniferum]|uniref:HMA domain-containing protein n=1 Tax=Papaver somniferum TaxID=3469 RepID=A0A4Y7KKN9_PAPSO|nr:uncharacterized protein LOC113304202 [Papaver somniferum]RZC72455.1 hypothetical protein C5167_047937 [Papaver somniferum]